jgi:single-strand selective monofunctional uracil DNA glycosylase
VTPVARTPPPQPSPTARALIRAALRLRHELAGLRAEPPVACIYRPLEYAWSVHRAYLTRYAATPRRVLFLGMNPGPFGMTQTGVPFGAVPVVRDWLALAGTIRAPVEQHPRRSVLGWACARVEVSGSRWWGGMAERFRTPERFFVEHVVLSYCPLTFLDARGANLTPVQLPAGMRAALHEPCDRHLRSVVAALGVEWVVGIGAYAAARAGTALPPGSARIGTILHPSPASPAANRGWLAQVTRQLTALGIWTAAEGAASAP